MGQTITRRRLASRLIALAAVVGTAGATMTAPAAAADPAVAYMEKVSRDLLSAARTQSPAAMMTVIQRHGDIPAIGRYSLGDYRPRLDASDEPSYLSGMVRFVSKYAASQAPKYPVASVKFNPESRRAQYGLMVDSTVTLQDGSSYDVAWMLVKTGNSYRVRDAQVMGFWMTPFLKKLFEDYIAQNNGNVKALVVVLNR